MIRKYTYQKDVKAPSVSLMDSIEVVLAVKQDDVQKIAKCFKNLSRAAKLIFMSESKFISLYVYGTTLAGRKDTHVSEACIRVQFEKCDYQVPSRVNSCVSLTVIAYSLSFVVDHLMHSLLL